MKTTVNNGSKYDITRGPCKSKAKDFMVHSDSILCFMKGWVRCMCALTGHIGVLSWCQDQRLPPTYLQDFFQVREDLLKSLRFPILHSCCPSTIRQQFSFSKTLYSFSKSSPNIFILQIFLLLHKKKFPLQIFFLSVFSPAQKNICLLQMFSFFPSPFFFSYAEQLFPLVQVFSFFSLSIISTGGALRRPMTYDKQSHPIHRSIWHVALNELERPKIDLSRPSMT